MVVLASALMLGFCFITGFSIGGFVTPLVLALVGYWIGQRRSDRHGALLALIGFALAGVGLVLAFDVRVLQLETVLGLEFVLIVFTAVAWPERRRDLRRDGS